MSRIRSISKFAIFCAIALPGIARADVPVAVEVQTHLTVLGYQPGGIDGAFGRGSRNALARFEREVGLPADGRIDDDVRNALLQRVEASQQQRFGRKLTGLWGTSQRCRSDNNRIKVVGYTVTHQPIWSEETFDYVIVPNAQGQSLEVVWDKGRRNLGSQVEYNRSNDSLRVPELNMFGVDDCRRFGVNEQVALTPLPAPQQGPTAPQTPNRPTSDLEQATLNELLEAVQAKIASSQASSLANEQELDQLRSANARLERRVQTFAERRNEQLREIQTLQTALTDRERRISDLEAQVQSRPLFGGNGNNNARQQVRALRAELAETQAALNFAQGQIQQLQQANQQLGAQLQANGRPTQSTTTTTTLSGEDALKIIIPQLLQNLGGN